MCVCMCVCLCMCVCVRACVRACVCWDPLYGQKVPGSVSSRVRVSFVRHQNKAECHSVRDNHRETRHS